MHRNAFNFPYYDDNDTCSKLLQMDYERSYYLISHIFERVAKRINKQVPSAETSETTEHKYCTSYHLHHVGIEITGEAMPLVRESKTSAMLKVLEFAENNCNFTIQDVTALWQNYLNYPGSSALAITIKATPTQTHFKRNNSWSVG